MSAMQTRWVRTLGWSVSVLGALALAAPAYGAGAKAACAVSGAAKTNPPVPIAGGKGRYTFESLTFACLGAEKGASPFLVVFDMESRGIYKSTACGLTKYYSEDNSPGELAVIFGETKTHWHFLADARMGYTLEVDGAAAAWYWNNQAVHKAEIPKAADPLSPKPQDDPNEGFAGTVTFSPDPTKNFVPCYKAFQVAGPVTIDTETAT